MKEALFDRENLLIWEKECNSNEIVIEALAKYLKM
jgi:ubiquitin thioesterase protein OTUB2